VDDWRLWLGVFAAYAAAAMIGSWVVVPWLSRQLDTGPFDGLVLVLCRTWARVMHRVRWEPPEAWEAAREVIRADRGAIVVANHASGIDPFVLQMPFRRRIRWLMARAQMLPALDGLWRRIAVIPVEYGPKDASSFREALRHVRDGGLLGIFPEGGIARPPGELRPFQEGAGFLIARGKVPVILCLIEGAPVATSALAGIVTRSRCVVRCLGVIDFSAERDPSAINARLRALLHEASGWPLNDEPIVATRAPEDGAARADRIPGR
jgi:1-acyl-sn-glycerol-3-phosphate acyltransferase